VIKNQIRCARITVVGKTNAPGVNQEPWLPSNAANARAMSMAKDNNRLAERTVDGFEFCIGRFCRGRSPATIRTGVDQGEALVNIYAREFPQPRQSFLSERVAGCRGYLPDSGPEIGWS